MFFTKVGLVIAWLLFIPSTIGLVLAALTVLTSSSPATDPLVLMLNKASNQYVYGVALGVAFGIAAEISKAIAARHIVADNGSSS